MDGYWRFHGGGVSTIGKTYLYPPPRERGLLRFYGYRKASLLFAKSFLIRVYGSMMFRQLQERVFVIREGSNSCSTDTETRLYHSENRLPAYW